MSNDRYRSVLLPVDGSRVAALALPWALHVARASSAVLHVLCVHDPSAALSDAASDAAADSERPPLTDPLHVDIALAGDAERLDAERRMVESVVARARDDGVRAEPHLATGTAVEALREAAEAQQVDLTVMATHGRSGFARLRLGSVASAYIATATAPVLLCRADASARESGNDAPSIDARTPLLCALDGSAFAEALLPHAVRFAQTLAVPLHLFSVVTPRALDLAPFATEALLADPDGLARDEDDRAAYLDGVADRLRAIQDGLEVTRQVTTDMRPAQAIHDEVVRVGACAVAMSTHARGGLTRLVLGSVTDVVVRECRAPVLVVRTDAPTAG